MPEKDGLTFIRELREKKETRELPIVVVSAYSDDGRHILTGDAFGVVDWLSKPIDVDLLRVALKNGLQSVRANHPRVLHVEDDSDIQALVRVSLSEGAEHVCAPTLKEAVHRVKSEAFDLIILDLGLPDGSGLDLLPSLRASSTPSTPVLVFSGKEISPLAARHVSAVLRTANTSNETLAASIQGFLGAHA
jgi:DNA-binding response OmpR family regulator